MRTALLSLLLLAGCITTAKSSPPGLSSAIVRRARPTAAWGAVEHRRITGYVVRFEPPGDPARFIYSVRNEHQQDLGVIDSFGRVYRYRPHADEPEWIGSGTVLFGVRRILGSGAGMRLVDVELVDEGADPPTIEMEPVDEDAPRGR
ncbi:MAG: hypothetical protein E2O39_08655 [Planctomycetota bacterium]|nr:MAG: hypothetical protein E2O39_08655 [Planctomycetota bacterium]